jgi:hypothetical protein
MAAVDEIKKQALSLGVIDRASLVELLLGSLPPVSQEWSEADELAEAERRESEIKSRRVQTIHNGEFWRCIEVRCGK